MPSRDVPQDVRFDVPIFTPGEVATHLGLPATTVRNWLGLTKWEPVVSRIATPVRSREASVPFIGLAEAYVLSAFRAAGLPLQRIRPAVHKLQQTVGLDHALANRRLMTHGAEILYEFSQETGDTKVGDLVVVRSDQIVFRELVEDYLSCITWAPDEYTGTLKLMRYGDANVVIDPNRNFGQPMFADGGTRLADVLDLFHAGEPIDVVSAEYGVDREQVEAAIRAVMPLAPAS